MTTKQWVTPLVVGGCWGLVVDGRAGVGAGAGIGELLVGVAGWTP
ncbi:MAG TPA: hypothetical protein VIL11_06500 [Limnochordales bacterium]